MKSSTDQDKIVKFNQKENRPMNNIDLTIHIPLTQSEYAVTQQLIRDTTDRHLNSLINDNVVPAPTQEEKKIIIGALRKLRIGWGIDSVAPVEPSPYDTV